MDPRTLAYETRPSVRTFCAHCRTTTAHHAFLDPNVDAWVEVCLTCEMVDLADDELEALRSGRKRKVDNRLIHA